MSEVTLLIDNDVVIKLSQMDCYADALSSIGRSSGQVGSLGFMLRFMGKSSASHRLRLAGSQAAADRLNRVLHSIAELEPTHEQQLFAARILKHALNQDLDLDPGEIGLFVVGVDLNHAEVATGDKKAIRGMPAIAANEPKLVILKGRILCLEQIFSKLCLKYGLPRIQTAISCCPDADATIREAYIRYGTSSHSFVQVLAYLIEQQIEKLAGGWLRRT